MKVNVRMRIIPFGMLIFCMSCVKYQYATVASSLSASENKELFIENDTLKISFHFAENGQFSLDILNKFNSPLYIDWDRSGIILGGTLKSYQTDGRNSITGFIPPQSHSTLWFSLLADFNRNTIEQQPSHKAFIETTAGPERSIHYDFDVTNTPLLFRNYITISTTESFSTVRHFDTEFWVSEINRTLAHPQGLRAKSLNQFYVSQSTVAGEVITGTFVIGAVVIGVAARLEKTED